MSSLTIRNRNANANVFLMVNLGCEMLFVIDQRLKAQRLPREKAEQVIHDILRMVLEENFLGALIQGDSILLTPDNCKFMLHDMARSSPLMNINMNSMERLWHLITIVHKWQLHLSRYPHHLLEITFRHLEALKTSLYFNNLKETNLNLIEANKDRLLEFWNNRSDIEQESIYETVKNWFASMEGKVSLLVRLGFQSIGDGHFLTSDTGQSHFIEFRDNIGENIYAKCAQLFHQQFQKGSSVERSWSTGSTTTAEGGGGGGGGCLQQLEDMLQLKSVSQTLPEPVKPYQFIFSELNATATSCNNEETNLLPPIIYRRDRRRQEETQADQ